MKLSSESISALPNPASGQAFYWDDQLKGFGVRITENGSRAWVVTYRVPSGKKLRKTIGRVGVMTHTDARKLATQHLLAASQGQSLETMRERARKLSLSELWQHYEEAGFPKPRKGYKAESTVRTDKNRWIAHVEPRMGDLRIDAITDADIEKLRTEIRRGGASGQGERCVALVKALLSYGRRFRLTDNVAGMKVVVEGSRKISNPLDPVKRTRLRKALAEMREEGESLFAAAAIEVALLTGMRLGEVLGLKWDWVRLDARAIELPQAKGDQLQGRVVLLSLDAVDVIKVLPRLKGNDHVFPGRRGSQPLVNITKPWAAAKARAKIPQSVRFHDLRHTFGTAAATAGVGPHALQSLMGHKDQKTTQRYIKLADSTLRAELSKLSL